MITRADLTRQIEHICDSRPTAADLAEKYAATWPTAASAAQRAAALVEAGSVIQRHASLPATDATPAQPDAWRVEGETCSHAGNACTCREAAHDDARFGRLCSHRIAVMIYKSLLRTNTAALGEIVRLMAEYISDSATDSGARRIVLSVDRYFRNDSQEDRKLLRMIGFARDAGTRADQFGQFEIDNAGLETITTAAGLTFTAAPSPGRSFRFYYQLAAPDAAHPAGDEARTLRQLDAAPYRAAEERRRQLAAETAAMNRLARAAA
jgi:hypothetical protein